MRARSLRAASTDTERRLWSLLRDRRLGGCNFRRQHPIGPWIVDFACVEARMIIEADGGQHGGNDDASRDADLAARGWRVLRFWNHDINGNLDGVAQTIVAALGTAGHPHPNPLPQAGEGDDSAAAFPAAASRPLSHAAGEGDDSAAASPAAASCPLSRTAGEG